MREPELFVRTAGVRVVKFTILSLTLRYANLRPKLIVNMNPLNTVYF